ncbi:MAG: Nre family DNA repair protein [Candidatus Thermoplasmatota archaeon]
MNEGKKRQNILIPHRKKSPEGLCGLCRGTKLLCGKTRCPVLVRYHSKIKVKPLIDSIHLGGASPPSVFIGRIGYPKVSIGPMIPPVMGNTTEIDTPELWLGKTLEDIVDFRSQLVRGKYTVDVFDVENCSHLVEYTRELALAKNPVFAEALFEKKPYGKTAFYDEVQPHGPSAPLKKLSITNPKYEPHLEKVYYDTDLNAREAIIHVYKNGVRISQIQRALSVGAFGIKKHRRFVPTRWSITAVDSTLGLELLKTTKTYPLINEYRVYHAHHFDNRWVIILTPTEWQYELIEAWYPNTTWNPFGRDISIYNSYEFFEGRKTYAEIGGCYYAARLAVNEALQRERRQAGAIILREAHPGYIMPIGVWNVRESVRNTLQQKYHKYDTLQEALLYASKILAIPLSRWIKNSGVLKQQLFQKRIEDFL